ncbi:MAG: hypothetical protein ACTSPY_06090 [Candidatus Helarchaeota archaeon]
MYYIIIPIKIICEKTARLIDSLNYRTPKEKEIINNEIKGYWHLNCIYKILEYILQKDGKIIVRRPFFNRDFFILSFFIADLRNIAIHKSDYPVKFKKDRVQWYKNIGDEQKKVKLDIDLIIDLELSSKYGSTIRERLCNMIKNLNANKNKFPTIEKEIGELIKLRDATFFTPIRIEFEKSGNSFQMNKIKLNSRINENSNTIYVEASKLLDSLKSYIYGIFSHFCQIIKIEIGLE